MTAGLAFIILSLSFSFVLNILFFSKKHIVTKETRIFSVIVFINFIGLIIELSCVLTIKYLGINSLLTIIVNRLYLVYLISFVLAFSLYVLNTAVLIKEKMTKVYKNLFKYIEIVSYILYFVAVFGVCILDINLYGNNGQAYSYGDAVNLVYVMCGISVVGCFIYIIRNFKLLKKSSRNIPIISFLLITAVLTILQKSHPELTIATSLETLIIFIMFHTIENPDLRMIEQLELARNQADKANRAKTEFLSSMSHEIRTPLNAISGFSDCILDAKTLEEAKENAKDIVDASGTLLDIVNGILDISKIEAGKLEIVNSPYNAPDTFNELAKLITPKMKEKGLDFTYYIAPDLPKTLRGDPANLKKIVTNILSNACKYTKTGFVRYEVNCVNMNDYTRLIISVEDSGQGIKKENINKLFTRFQRLEEDKNTTIEGTGLGLAITKQLTELMGGKIIVHSIYGTGSKFTVVLNQKIETNEVLSEHKYKTTLNLDNIKILVVDDNVLNLKVATKLLQRHNANDITTCESGFDCISRIGKGEKYDIIMLDDMMPKMSGVQTLHKLKDIAGFDTPVIALTANAITGMKEHYLSEGFNSYLAKPIQDDELIRTMNEVLGRTITEKIPIVQNEEKTEKTSDKDNEIIPVEDNIEYELGNKLDISTETVEKEKNDDQTVIKNNETKYDINYLKENNVDVDSSIQLLGDVNTYNTTVSAYLDDVESRWERIVKYKDAIDMTNYAIEVHSLKSSSKYVGLIKLSEIAYQHELKSKENDIGYINDHFSELESEYLKDIEIIKNYVRS